MGITLGLSTIDGDKIMGAHDRSSARSPAHSRRAGKSGPAHNSCSAPGSSHDTAVESLQTITYPVGAHWTQSMRTWGFAPTPEERSEK